MSNGPYTTPDKKDFIENISGEAKPIKPAAAALAAVVHPRPAVSVRLSADVAHYVSIMRRAALKEQTRHPNGRQNSQSQTCPTCGGETGPGRPGRECKPCRNGETAHLPKKPEPIKIYVGTQEGIDHAIDQAKAEAEQAA